MNRKSGWRWLMIGIAVAVFARVTSGEDRLWTDSTGDFSVMAELVKIERGNAVLREQNGKEITVPLRRLSDRDRAFIKAQRTAAEAPEKAQERGPAQIAEEFYNELRSENRDVVREMLTPKAKEVMKDAKSPLAQLPAPEEGNRSIRVGRPAIDGKVAEVPVQVRAAGMMHKTKVHLRQEGEDWLVFALSAEYPDGEKSLNFEAPPAKEGGSTLEALVGQPFALAGVTLDGRPLDVSQFQGKVVLIDFWATWCGPCRAEIPNMLANYEKFHNNGFDVIAVSVDEDLEALAEFVTTEKPPWTVLIDNFPGNRNSMAAKYGISSIPAFILVGPDGKVVAVNCRGEALGQQLTKLFAGADRETDTRYAARQQPGL